MLRKQSPLPLCRAAAVPPCPACSLQPPELLRYGRMSPAVDVYAFGVMSECQASSCCLQVAGTTLLFMQLAGVLQQQRLQHVLH